MGLAEPRIEEKGNFVDVEFYRPKLEVPDSAGYRQIVPEILTLQESKVLGYVDEHGKVSTADVERLLAVKARRAREGY
jgi:ATP-dependent DNA helicase RecG